MCLVFIIIIEFHHHHYLLVFLTVNLVLFRRSATYLGLVVPTGLNTSHVLALQARGANAMFKEVEGQQIQIPPLPLHLSLYPRLVTIATNYGSWVPPMVWVEMHIYVRLCAWQGCGSCSRRELTCSKKPRTSRPIPNLIGNRERVDCLSPVA